MIIYRDKDNRFIEFFNENNGFLMRTNVLDENGNETIVKPMKRNFPELVDIGIMGHCHVENKFCKEMGIGCYQANNNYKDMEYDDYKSIIRQLKGKTFQVALGGKGDPNKHKHFKDILEFTRKNGIIPNLTTSGFNITNEEINLIQKYCGAIAVSMYSKISEVTMEESNHYTLDVINALVSSNIKTNIHYVISKNTIDDAIFRLKYDLFPNNINAVVFLLCKRVGRTSDIDLINTKTDKFNEFIYLLKKKHKYKIGFDTCFTPLIQDKIKINKETIEYCEAAKFSCYISPNMYMYPCSFVQKKEYGISIRENSIRNVWNSKEFQDFINLSINNSGYCPDKLNIL